MSLKYEPSLEPLHISAEKLFLNRELMPLKVVDGGILRPDSKGNMVARARLRAATLEKPRWEGS